MSRQPSWARWPGSDRTGWTLGVEEEVMLLDPHDWALAQAIDDVLETLPDELRDQMSSETHSAAIELQTGIHRTVETAVDELTDLRAFVTFDGERAHAIPGGLSRVAYDEGELVINSSQGGGAKDTWVLER